MTNSPRLRHLSGKDVRRLLEEFAGRLDTGGEVHRLLAHRSSGAPVDIANYLETIVQGLVSSLTANGHTSIYCLFPLRLVLPAEQAVALGLLVGELVTNTIKYAHPAGVAGAITIEASTHDDQAVAIEVCDDGVGLPNDIDPLQSQSLGFSTIPISCQAAGSFDFVQQPWARTELRCAHSLRRAGAQSGILERESANRVSQDLRRSTATPRSAIIDLDQNLLLRSRVASARLMRSTRSWGS
jgi:two-component sensor histidine kinase